MDAPTALLVTQIVSVLQGVSLIAASIVAIRGINAWSREHTGKKRIDVAEEMLNLFFRARDAISYIRGPDGFYEDGDPLGNSPNTLVNATKVPVRRMNENSELFAQIRAMRTRAMALFGESAAEPFTTLDDILEDIEMSSVALALNYKYVDEHPDAETPPDAAAFMEVLKNKLVRQTYNDPLKPAIDRMIAQVIAICPPEIRKGLRPATWWRRLFG
jgi:hypothetical protein